VSLPSLDCRERLYGCLGKMAGHDTVPLPPCPA
jgi:hypothetical protein